MEEYQTLNIPNGSAAFIRQAVEQNDRTVLAVDGQAMAALISLEELQHLEALEDELDARDAEKALAEWEASGEPAIPWEEVRKTLGVDG